MNPKYPHPFILLAFVLMAGMASAATVTFEAGQGYALGTIAPVNGSTSNAPFNGQQNWSRSTSDGTGGIFATGTSGEYTGGQALSGGTLTTAETYIGGKTGIVDTTLSSSITFDLRFNSSSATVSAGFLNDDGDGLFDNATDTGMQFGFNGGFVFLRNAGFGTNFNLVDFAEEIGDWYRIGITVGAIVSSNRSIDISLRNLTDGVDVDLNGGSAGNDYSTSVTDANFGIAPEDAVGGFVRITQTGSSNSDANRSAVDNLTFTAVPEPGSALLGGIGVLLLLHRVLPARLRFLRRKGGSWAFGASPQSASATAASRSA